MSNAAHRKVVAKFHSKSQSKHLDVDANQVTGRGNHNAASINLPTVKAGKEKVIAFVNLIERQLSD